MQYVSANGAEIPAIGFGTWTLRGSAGAKAVAEAVGIGYRHIDTAAGYGNETEVGEGIRASGVPRSEIFLTTKVQPENLADGVFQKTVEGSLKRLRMDQVDLVLIHWPSQHLAVADTIRPLNDVKRRGLTRHIGVSNFTLPLLAEAWAATSEPLVTNQCEYHPYLNQDRVLAACRAKGMSFTAYAPLGRRGCSTSRRSPRPPPGMARPRPRSCFAGRSSSRACWRSRRAPARTACGRICRSSISR